MNQRKRLMRWSQKAQDKAPATSSIDRSALPRNPVEDRFFLSSRSPISRKSIDAPTAIKNKPSSSPLNGSMSVSNSVLYSSPPGFPQPAVPRPPHQETPETSLYPILPSTSRTRKVALRLAASRSGGLLLSPGAAAIAASEGWRPAVTATMPMRV